MQNTTSILVIVLVVLLVVLLGGAGMMGFGMMGGGMTLAPHASAGVNGMMGGYGGYGYNPLGAIISLASWVLIIGGVALLAVYVVRNAKSSSASNQAPLDILKARYARGEITKEQFDAIKRDLEA